MLRKSAIIKRFEYSPQGRDLKAQTDIGKKQYHKLDNTYEFDKTKNKNQHLKAIVKSDLIYNSNYSFCKYYRNSE